MKAVFKGWALSPLFVLMFWTPPAHGRSTAIISPPEASAIVAVLNNGAQDGVVSGVVVNKSPRPVRDVELLIRHEWRWSNERHPGSHSPGRADRYLVRSEIPAGATLPFTYQTADPLPARADGRFITSVEVMSFTEIGN